MKARYLFGANSAAAARLELLARIFQESTREFLRGAGPQRKIPLAIDIGCGPGLTTRLIADNLDCERVVGLDSSPEFIEAAQGLTNNWVNYQPCGS